MKTAGMIGGIGVPAVSREIVFAAYRENRKLTINWLLRKFSYE